MLRKFVTNFNKRPEQSILHILALKETLYIFSLLVLGTCIYGTEGTDVNLIPRYLVATILLLLGFVAFFKDLRKKGKTIPLYHYDLLVVGYSLLHFASIGWSQNVPEAIFESGKSIVFLAGYFLLRALISGNTVLQKKHLNRINLLITALVMVAIIVQFANMMTNFKYPSPYHIKGFSSHKNLLSSFLFLLLPLNILGCLKEKGAFRTLFITSIALQLVSIVLLQSRAVYVGLGLGVLFFVFTNLGYVKGVFSNNAKRILVGGGGLLLVVLGLAFFSGFAKTLKEKVDVTQFAESRSAKERVVLWKNSLELIAERPLLGHGAGNWKIHFPRTGLGELERASFYDAFFLRPHNDYISIFSELGVLGLALFLLIFLMPIVWYFKSAIDSRSLKFKLLIATLVGFLAVFFFDFPKERIEHQLYLALILALIWVETTSIKKGVVGFDIPIGAPILAICSLLLWNAYSGYQRQSADKWVNSIFQANEKSQWNEMVSLTQKSKNAFYNIDPISNPIDWFAGVAEFQLGNEKKAEALLVGALNAHPNNHKVYNSLAGVYNRMKDYPRAIEQYEKALALNPFYEKAIINIAITYFQSGNPSKAEEWINKSREESELKSRMLDAIKKAQKE